LQTRLAEFEAERIERDSAFQELDHTSAGLHERVGALTRAFGVKEAAMAQAEETIVTLKERIAALEQAMESERQTAERSIDDFKAAPRREQMERSVVQGALDTVHKDFSHAMRPSNPPRNRSPPRQRGRASAFRHRQLGVHHEARNRLPEA
jgi:chromosome segregation ATPase